MVLAIACILLFFSIGYFAYAVLPLIMERYSLVQQKRMESASKGLDRLFVATESTRMLKIFRLTPLVLGGVGFFVAQFIGLAIGAVLGLIVPKIIMKNMEAMRRNKFQDQIVDALMILSSALKSGMSLNQAFEIVVEEMPVPLAEEFSLVLKENHMGVPLEECLKHLRQRMPVDDLGLITSAITVARETGGDLTEVFSQLVFTIREKNKLERKVRTLTVQGRLQGVIMAVLPIAFAAFIHSVNPENFNIMLNNEMGKMLLVWAVMSELIGIILIKRLSRVDV